MKIARDELKEILIEGESLEFYTEFVTMIRGMMEHPEYLREYNRTELLSILKNKGVILMYQYGNILGASSIIYPAPKNELKEMNIDPEDKKIIIYGPYAVFEDYRGNGIQKFMIERCDKLSKSLGYSVAIIRVHPDDTYSIHNIENSGFQYIGNYEYKKETRRIYQKEL